RSKTHQPPRLPMKLHPNIWKFAALAFAMSFAACKCERTVVGSRGEMTVVFEEDNVSKSSLDARYDFGAVFMGTKNDQSMKLTVKNVGRGSITLDKLERAAPPDDANSIQIG